MTARRISLARFFDLAAVLTKIAARSPTVIFAGAMSITASPRLIRVSAPSFVGRYVRATLRRYRVREFVIGAAESLSPTIVCSWIQRHHDREVAAVKRGRSDSERNSCRWRRWASSRNVALLDVGCGLDLVRNGLGRSQVRGRASRHDGPESTRVAAAVRGSRLIQVT
jgi:hypothetical protein